MAQAAQRMVRVPILYHEGPGGPHGALGMPPGSAASLPRPGGLPLAPSHPSSASPTGSRGSPPSSDSPHHPHSSPLTSLASPYPLYYPPAAAAAAYSQLTALRSSLPGMV